MRSFKSFLMAGIAISFMGNIALADTIIPFDKDGMAILEEADGIAGFGPMVRFREPQRLQTYCGVASSIATLNSLGIESELPSPDIYPYNQFNQYTFFTKAVLAIKVPVKVQTEGIELDNLGRMLNTFNHITATVYHAGSGQDLTDLETTRKAIAGALVNTDSRVIINFHRKTLGQVGGGHFSPLAAYDSKTDRVLILDTASYKLPPVWVTMTDLWNAMATVDSDGAGPGKPANRGFIVIHKNPETNVEYLVRVSSEFVHNHIW